MRVVFLGTAAYEGHPNVFCDCENCRKVMEAGSRNFRLTSAVHVDSDLLIDFGPNIMAGAHEAGVTLFNVKTLLITHSHSDHLYLPNFGYRMNRYNASYDRLPTLTILANSTVLSMISSSLYFDPDKTVLIEAEPYKEVVVNGCSIFPVPAVHKVKEGEQPYLFLLKKGGKSFFYATDTGPIDESSLKLLREFLDDPVDIVALDSTLGFMKEITFPYHHTAEQVITTMHKMREIGIIDGSSLLVAHHFSHYPNPPQRDLEEFYGRFGISVASDGLLLDI
ncbi:MBL fold metallo-hydrolase [Mesotoga sp.]|jgi:phosphoribosyl 1,2-cyclic phosphate phosphodiesterase|uniref:MBL fold metallo-hydrolase n=1 Tax=Mesotoga sp. TaxID=2053577 RepID=UPI00356251A4